MKIKYQFATETVEIEVSDDWGNLLIDLDRQEYNINHKETRRHCSLEAYNADGTLLPSDEDVEQDILAEEDDRRLKEAIAALDDEQRELIDELFFQGMTVSEYGKRHGISQPAASQRKAAVIKKLKKIFD